MYKIIIEGTEVLRLDTIEQVSDFLQNMQGVNKKIEIVPIQKVKTLKKGK